MRVGGGELRGRRLDVPPGIRPSEGKVKEALFSIWTDRLEGATFLDLFAGSGAVGLEAVSRGALSATFIEAHRGAATILKRNMKHLPDASWNLRIESVELALPALAAAGARFDLIFLDPPYSRALDEELMTACAVVLADSGRIAAEHDARAKPGREVAAMIRIETRRYGESALSFYGKS